MDIVTETIKTAIAAIKLELGTDIDQGHRMGLEAALEKLEMAEIVMA